MLGCDALTLGPFAETCAMAWGDRKRMRHWMRLLSCVALSLQKLNPNEATGAHADSILSEVGALALVTQGQRIQGAALISALRTDGDAVVPMHGPR